MSFNKFIKKYLYLIMLVISTFILTVIGYVGKDNIYADYKVKSLSTPQLVAVFEGAVAGKYPWMVGGSYSRNGNGHGAISASAGGSNQIVKTIHDIKKPSHIKDEGKSTGGQKNPNKPADGNKPVTPKPEPEPNPVGNDNGGKVDEIVDKPSIPDSESNEEITPAPSDVPKVQFETVNEDYFGDALFIGDSRTVGLSEYSGWKKPTFYADEGMSIYDAFDRKIANVNGKNGTIPEALKEKQFKKIYIMLGINELGTGNTKRFVNKYSDVISQIRKLQPDAIIFIQGIMDVAKNKSDKDPIYNNKNIRNRNNGIAQLADNKNIFYIDVNEALVDQYGNIPEKYTFDSIHLKAAYYKLWTKFLEEHGVSTEP